MSELTQNFNHRMPHLLSSQGLFCIAQIIIPLYIFTHAYFSHCAKISFQSVPFSRTHQNPFVNLCSQTTQNMARMCFHWSTVNCMETSTVMRMNIMYTPIALTGWILGGSPSSPECLLLCFVVLPLFFLSNMEPSNGSSVVSSPVLMCWVGVGLLLPPPPFPSRSDTRLMSPFTN